MGNGFTSRLTRDGFSRHTGESKELAEFFINGSSSRALPDALRFNLNSPIKGIIRCKKKGFMEERGRIYLCLVVDKTGELRVIAG